MTNVMKQIREVLEEGDTKRATKLFHDFIVETSKELHGSIQNENMTEDEKIDAAADEVMKRVHNNNEEPSDAIANVSQEADVDEVELERKFNEIKENNEKHSVLDDDDTEYDHVDGDIDDNGEDEFLLDDIEQLNNFLEDRFGHRKYYEEQDKNLTHDKQSVRSNRHNSNSPRYPNEITEHENYESYTAKYEDAGYIIDVEENDENGNFDAYDDDFEALSYKSWVYKIYTDDYRYLFTISEPQEGVYYVIHEDVDPTLQFASFDDAMNYAEENGLIDISNVV